MYHSHKTKIILRKTLNKTPSVINLNETDL